MTVENQDELLANNYIAARATINSPEPSPSPLPLYYALHIAMSHKPSVPSGVKASSMFRLRFCSLVLVLCSHVARLYVETHDMTLTSGGLISKINSLLCVLKY